MHDVASYIVMLASRLTPEESYGFSISMVLPSLYGDFSPAQSTVDGKSLRSLQSWGKSGESLFRGARIAVFTVSKAVMGTWHPAPSFALPDGGKARIGRPKRHTRTVVLCGVGERDKRLWWPFGRLKHACAVD
jgi:hypothetical protein